MEVPWRRPRYANRVYILGFAVGPTCPLRLLVRSCDYKGFISRRARSFGRLKKSRQGVGLKVLGWNGSGLEWKYIGRFPEWRYWQRRWVSEMPFWSRSPSTGRWHIVRSVPGETLRDWAAATLRSANGHRVGKPHGSARKSEQDTLTARSARRS